MPDKKFDKVRPISWRDDALHLLDQRLLPQRHEEMICRDVGTVAQAIEDMVVRGAPAIGITAAYGVALAGRARFQQSSASWRQDIEANYHMGHLGAAFIDPPCAVLTHCNAGALATGGYGTALGVIRSAFAAGRIHEVFADETRPWLQGARLTAWELLQDGIPTTLVAEGAGAHLLHQGAVRWIIVGADRIAANGDVANKIGTYNLAVTARYHNVRFMVVAPTSTIDMRAAEGNAIPIEMRAEEELLCLQKQRIAAAGASAWNPVFDVTPASLVDVIVTEKGVVEAPNAAKIATLMAD